MNNLTTFECDLLELKSFANKLAIKTKLGEIYLLTGDLGVGKTTFTRFFIDALYDKYQIRKPENIKSPSYPVLINYPLLNFEIYHYDLYRLKKIDELLEIDFFENFEKNVSIIEWPEIIIKNFNLNNYHLINLNFVNINIRKIQHQYFNLNVS